MGKKSGKKKSQFQIFFDDNKNELTKALKSLVNTYPYVLNLSNVFLSSKTEANVSVRLKDNSLITTKIRKCSISGCLSAFKTDFELQLANSEKNVMNYLFLKILTTDDYNCISENINNQIKKENILVNVNEFVQVFYKNRIKDSNDSNTNELVFSEPLANLINLKEYIEVTVTETKLTKTKEKIIKSISKKLLTRLKKVQIKTATCEEIRIIAKQLYAEYKEKNDLRLNAREGTMYNVSYSHPIFEPTANQLTTKDLTILYVDNKAVVKLKPSFEKVFNLVKSDNFQIAKKTLNNYFKTLSYKISGFKGRGLLIGRTIITVSKSDWKNCYDIEINQPFDENDTVEEWITKIKECIECNISIIERRIEKEREQKELKAKRYRESFLARDIILFVKRNEKYITENAVTQYMLGHRVQLNTYISELDNFSPYIAYTKEDVLKVIHNLIQDDILEEWAYKGTFGTFYTLHLVDDNDLYVLKNINQNEIVCDPFLKSAFNDFEAEKIFFDYEKKINLSIKDYMLLFKFIHVKGFLSKYYDQYICIMQSAPKEFKQFIKMKINEEQDQFNKKTLKLLIKKAKKESAITK